MTTPPSPMSRARAGWRAAQPADSPGSAAPVVLPRGTGREINAGGMPALELIHPDMCDGALQLIAQPFPPGRLVRAHWHAAAAQWSVVIAGTLMFRVGSDVHEVRRGGLIWRPPGVVHAVWNPGPGPAWQIEGNVPGEAMSRYYQRYEELTADGQADAEEIAALASAYGVYFDDAVTREIERESHVSAGLPAGGGPRP